MAADLVHVFEVGPRDGLQNEKTSISLKDKVNFVQDLLAAGVRDIELGAFVRSDKVPQMADTDEIYRMIGSGQLQLGKASSWCLVPNLKGLERALQVGVRKIAVFTAATNSFNQRNIGMTIPESLAEISQVITTARSELGSKLKVRGYVSTAFGCPFEGKTPPSRALKVIEKLADLGVDQLSVGDTIGVATPRDVDKLMRPVFKSLGVKKTAVHFHDTRGTALANTLRALDLGIRIVDSSAGGFGGCPFAPGASGNLPTEDLVYMLNGMGIKTGINLERLCAASLTLSKKMNRPLTSRYLQAFVSH